MSARAWPFESKYLRDFAVVEERRGNLRLVPATEQLPVLSKEIEKEFRAGLTARLAATDGRADPFRKYQLSDVVSAFCMCMNSARPDHLHLQPYFTPDHVTQVALVQQITEIGSGGNRIWFRFFRGNVFLPAVYLSGKRLVFSGHAIDRYRQRTLRLHIDVTVHLLYHLFSIVTALRLNENQPVLAFSTEGTMAALPFEETDEEFFILTTLIPDGRSTLARLEPPRSLYFHYGPTCPPPANDGRFDMEAHIEELLKDWRNRTPPASSNNIEDMIRNVGWTRCVQALGRMHKDKPPQQIVFHENVYGPTVMTRPLR